MDMKKKADRGIKKILDMRNIESRDIQSTGARYLIDEYITRRMSPTSNPVTVLSDFLDNADFTRNEINELIRIAKNALKCPPNKEC